MVRAAYKRHALLGGKMVKNTFGTLLRVTTFGESHGEGITFFVLLNKKSNPLLTVTKFSSWFYWCLAKIINMRPWMQKAPSNC